MPHVEIMSFEVFTCVFTSALARTSFTLVGSKADRVWEIPA
jgi:hypothetical protein